MPGRLFQRVLSPCFRGGALSPVLQPFALLQRRVSLHDACCLAVKSTSARTVSTRSPCTCPGLWGHPAGLPGLHHCWTRFTGECLSSGLPQLADGVVQILPPQVPQTSADSVSTYDPEGEACLRAVSPGRRAEVSYPHSQVRRPLAPHECQIPTQC